MSDAVSNRTNLSRPHLAAAILLNAAVFIALCILAPRMKPLHPASSANFWYAVTGVDIGATKHDQLADVIFDRDRFVFGSQYPFETYFDLPYGVISEADAETEFPRVQKVLARRAALNDPNDAVAAGYARWDKIRDMNFGIAGLIKCIGAERELLIDRKSFPDVPVSLYPEPNFEEGLRHAAQTERLYWANFVFELVLFSGIIWFALLPYIRRASTARKLFRVAAVPLLLYLPMWFGYCSPVNPGFPIGGILYPYVELVPMVIPNLLGHYPCLWEYHFLSWLPPFLVAITQGRAYSFADLYDLRNAIPNLEGPVTVAILSALFAAGAAACHLGVWWWRKHYERCPPGFPVLDVGSGESREMASGSETPGHSP